MSIDKRFCWLCKKYDEYASCGESLGKCKEWKKFIHNIKAHHLKTYRKATGLTQLEVGKKLYRSRSWVGSVENGETRLTDDVITEFLEGANNE